MITCARGSSDHAATYAKYLIETRARVLTASAAPSISSVYGAAQDLRGCLFIALSQSGRSPDLLASVAAAKAAGATILALCNSPDAPLILAADLVIELRSRRRGQRGRHQVLSRDARRAAPLGRGLDAKAPRWHQLDRRAAAAHGSELGARLVGGAIAAARAGRASVRGGPRLGARPPRKKWR